MAAQGGGALPAAAGDSRDEPQPAGSIASGSYDPASGLPVPGGLSAALWADAHAQVQDCLHHPFVAGLAAGTLPA